MGGYFALVLQCLYPTSKYSSKNKLLIQAIQFSCIHYCVSVFAMLGMLSPASRGALMTAAIFLYVFMGLIAGYFSARLYKTMKGREWKRAAFLVSADIFS
jgi:hypothetical protein